MSRYARSTAPLWPASTTWWPRRPRRVADEPRFSPGCTEPPEVLGLIGTADTSAICRVALRTTPSQRAPLERALRQEVLAALIDAGLWPGTDDAATQAPAEAPDATG